jgi:hypothetical protein
MSDEGVDLPDSDVEIVDSSSNGRIPLRPNAFTLNEVYDAISKYTDWSSTPGSTQDTYKQRLYQIMTRLTCDTFDDMVTCFKYGEHIYTIFVDKFAYGAKDFFGVIHTLNKASQKYRKLMGKDLLEKYKKYERDYVELYKQEAFTKTEFESAIPMKSLVKAHDVLKRKDPISMQTLITRMYLDRALRDNFGDVKMMYRQKEKPPSPRGNYYNLPENVFYLREYKVSKRYGPQEFGLSDEAVGIIKAQILDKGKNRDYLIEKASGGKYTDGKLSTFVRESFESSGVKFPSGVNPNINNIRKATVSNLLGNKQFVTMKERLELANKMLHSWEVQMMIYNRKGGNGTEIPAKKKPTSRRKNRI